MPDLLLELRSEEIPARMQRKAAGDLRKLVTDALVDAGLTYEAAREYWTPRRLALDVRGLTARSKDVREEIKGPPVKAPEQAVQGFLRKVGLNSVEEAQIQSDPKKGDFYVAVIEKKGRAADEIIADVMPGIIRDFPWPKSMRWGKASRAPGSLRWVRPLQSIVCTFGPETEEPVVVDFEVEGIAAGNVTFGHRFHAPDAFKVRRFDDYVAGLEKAKVVLDAERRKQMILADAKNLAFAAGLELVEDEALLEEVSGLVEWPVVLMGEFEQEFLQIPDEVTRLTIKTNQKCFVTRKDGVLSNRFILVSNIEAKDGGAEIAYGNGKVVRARLSDALYFWNTDQADLPDLDKLRDSAAKFGLDLKKPLDQRMARLDHLGVTFHAKLGSQGERVMRIAKLAEELAPVVGADPAKARRAAILAKADLQTEVVGEFPEVQGAMGRTYASLQGEDEAVALAIEDHYKPQGPSDAVPADPVSIAVALADKLDTLVGFWAIDEKPTGSKDPYALRRAALGVIRIVAENGVRLGLGKRIADQVEALLDKIIEIDLDPKISEIWSHNLEHRKKHSDLEFIDWLKLAKTELPNSPELSYDLAIVPSDLLTFFHDRLKVYLRDQGARYDLIDAVLASGRGAGDGAISPLEGEMGGNPEGGRKPSSQTPPSALPGISPSRGEISQNDDLLLIIRRVEALAELLDTEDGRNLLAGTKRAVNILGAEEKKGTEIAPHVDQELFIENEERNLFNAVNLAEKEAAEAIRNEDFSAAMRAMSQLRAPVDTFFDHVMVNDEDETIRANRLALLARIRAVTGQVADFSKIAG